MQWRGVHARRRVVTLVVLLTAALLVWRSDAVSDWFAGILESADGVVRTHPVAGRVLFVVVSGASAMLAFLSTAPLVPVATHVWGEAATLLLLWAGWILGGFVAYAVGRHLGRAVVVRLVPEERLAAYEARINKNTRFLMVLLFQLALPSEVPSYLLGIVRYPFGTYALAVAAAELPYAFAAVLLGESFVDERYLTFASVLVAGTLFAILAARILHRKLDDNEGSGPGIATPQLHSAR